MLNETVSSSINNSSSLKKYGMMLIVKLRTRFWVTYVPGGSFEPQRTRSGFAKKKLPQTCPQAHTHTHTHRHPHTFGNKNCWYSVRSTSHVLRQHIKFEIKLACYCHHGLETPFCGRTRAHSQCKDGTKDKAASRKVYKLCLLQLQAPSTTLHSRSIAGVRWCLISPFKCD